MAVNENTLKTVFVNSLSKVWSSTAFYVITFALLTAVAAQISIPVKPVPFTLQTMMVMLAGAFLGAKRGAYSQILYLAMGAAGLPVFAPTPDSYFGIASLFGPTGGYLLSFPIAAFVTGLLVERYHSYSAVTAAMFLGNILVIAFGVIYLNTFFIRDWSNAIAYGAAIFSLWTVAKVIISTAVYFTIRKNSSK